MKTTVQVMLLAVAGALSAYAGYTAAQNWRGAMAAWTLAVAAIGGGMYALRETVEMTDDLETRGCQFPRAGTSFRVKQEGGRMNG